MRKGQKMPEELRKKRSEWMKKNPINYWKGKKREGFTLTEEGRERIIHALKTRKVSEKVIAHASTLNKGKTGKNHPKWVENKKRPFHKAIRTTFEYKKWRKQIYERDQYTCQMCRTRGGDLEVDHHPKRFTDILKDNNITTLDEALSCKELWECEGRTLCRPCHETTFRL